MNDSRPQSFLFKSSPSQNICGQKAGQKSFLLKLCLQLLTIKVFWSPHFSNLKRTTLGKSTWSRLIISIIITINEDLLHGAGSRLLADRPVCALACPSDIWGRYMRSDFDSHMLWFDSDSFTFRVTKTYEVRLSCYDLASIDVRMMRNLKKARHE